MEVEILINKINNLETRFKYNWLNNLLVSSNNKNFDNISKYVASISAAMYFKDIDTIDRIKNEILINHLNNLNENDLNELNKIVDKVINLSEYK